MPLELGLWRIDSGLKSINKSSLDSEARLEDILNEDISIASPNWMIIGRQIHTNYGGRIDLLAIDRAGNLVVLELKRNQTPRDVVAQLLDYGSWVKDLQDDDISEIFTNYQQTNLPGNAKESFDEAFKRWFKVSKLPENLNQEHELVVVASTLDESTERIVSYLADVHNVSINAIFFHVFKDDGREYLSRVWFRDPWVEPPIEDEWNGEFYGSFSQGDEQQWTDAVKYGFFCAGGGRWYSGTLSQLESGGRIWVNLPGEGYIGVGIIEGQVTKASEFKVESEGGKLLSQLPLAAKSMLTNNDDMLARYVVPVRWIKTVKPEDAIKEKGFFGNQNSVAKPSDKKWRHTVERLKQRFGI